MIQVVVIADDLTGANATGVQISKNGLKVFTLMTNDNESVKTVKGCDCLITETNSRAIDANEARKRVFDMGTELSQHDRIKVFSKRIDSTLRGNLGSETDAFLEVLGDDYIAIAVPAFPFSGRISIGGRLLVNNIPLHLTEVATDPKTPINTPVIADIFAKQTKYEIGSIYIEELNQGPHHLSKRILALKAAGKKIIIIDATTEAEIDTIAHAVVDSKVKFLAVDPGVFTSSICKHLIKPISEVRFSNNKVLVVVGSVNSVASNQVQKFLSVKKSNTVFIHVNEFLLGEDSRQTEINRVVTEIELNKDDYEISSIIGSGIYPENRINLKYYADERGVSIDDVSDLINKSIAEIVQRLLTSVPEFKGLYTSGGDISVAVCELIQAIGLELVNEVVPLAAYGILQGGQHEGLKLITKGGMVGDEDAIITCVEHLKGEIFND